MTKLKGEAVMWWMEDTAYDAGLVNTDWVLDPEIPSNYIPVPAADELYMVVDTAGNIVEYRHRYHAPGDDITWYWEVVNPDIPENFVAVEGVDNLYEVTDEYGNTYYLLYIRNEDDTYAFVEADANGNIIESVYQSPTGEEIPDNYIEVKDDMFAVVNDENVIIGYKQKETVTSDDGVAQTTWMDIPASSISGVLGVSQQVTTMNGGVSPNFTEGTTHAQGTQSKPAVTQAPGITTFPQGNSYPSGYVTDDTPTTTKVPAQTQKPTTSKRESTSTKTEVTYHTEIVGGYKITYKDTITYTYDENGNLLSTKKNTVEESREIYNGGVAPDTSLIKSNIDAEITRVCSSVTYKTDIANDILTSLNAERASQRLPVLTMSDSSNAMKLAKLLAADMATYNYCDYESRSYGMLSDLMNRYSISTTLVSGENIWQCVSTKTANDIHSRFQALESARTTRMSSNATSIGIAVAYANGYYYIVEVIL